MELPINVKVIVRTLMSGEGIQKIGSYISSFFKEPLIKFKEFQASRAEKYLSEREAKISKEEEIRKSFLEREAKLIEYINKEILPFIQKLQMAKYLTEDQAKTSETILKALNTEKELKKTITDMDQAKTIAQKVQKEYYEKYVKQIIEEEKSQKRIQEIEQKRQEGYRRWLEQRRELKKLQEISETVRPIRELELREKRPIQRELISFGLPTKFVLGLVPGRTREDIEKLKYLSETYKDFLRSKFTEKEVELILKRLSSEKLENLRKQYFLGAEQASYFRTILREEKEKIKLEKQAIAEKERAKKEELKLQQQLKREKEKEIQIETSRQILIERISAYRADPRIRKFIEQQGELNEKSKEELQLILSKIYQLRTVEGILYRQRLEWDRIGNSLRFFGMILSGIWYSGIAAVRQFSVEVLKGQGALDLTQKQILSLKYTTGALGIQFDDLIQGIGNIYQALISAGQGTSFVAERVKEALDKVGISYYKLGEEMKPSYESFWQVIFALKELEVQFGRSWVAQKLLGTQFERFAPLLGLSTEDLKRLKSESEDFANRMVIDTDAIVKANVNLGKIIQELKLTYIKIFGDIVASSKSFFEKLKDITTSIAELWVKLPNGLKSFAAYALIYLGPGSFVLGSIVRFGDTLARIINSLPALVIGFKEVFVTISSLVLTHPILSGIVVLLTAIGGALSGLIERKRKQIDLEAQWREKAEEAYKSYAQTIQNLSKAIEQGFRPTKASITELKQSLLDLDKAMVKYYRGEIKKEELVKAFEVIKSKITPITQEYQDWLKTRRLTILTENDVKKILEETEIKIKENNLSLKEQFYIYDELSKRIIIENLNQETINQVLEKRASIIKEILGKFEELRKELTRSEGEIPFIKNYLDGLNKIKELEEYIPIIRQTKGIQETINAQKLLNDYRLRLQKIYHREFLEAESKNLSDIIDLNKQLGRFISKTYYQAKEVEAKRHTSELESIEQTYNQAILELTQKQSLDEIPKIEQLKNQEIEKEHKKHILNLLNLDKRLIDDRIDLMNKELEAYEIRLKDKEISEKELTDIYSQEKKIISDTISDIRTLSNSDYSRTKIKELTLKLMEQEIEYSNNLRQIQERNLKDLKDSIEKETKAFEIRKRSSSEYYQFYYTILTKIRNYEGIVDQDRKELMDEYYRKLREVEEKILTDRLKNLDDLIKTETFTTEYRKSLIDSYVKYLDYGLSKGFLTYQEFNEKLLDITIQGYSKILKETALMDPFSSITDRLINFGNYILTYLSQYRESIQVLLPEERLKIFSQILDSVSEHIKEQKLTSADIENIFNQTKFKEVITNLGDILGLAPEIINQSYGNLLNNLTTNNQKLIDLINQTKEILRDSFESIIQDFSTGFYSLTNLTSQLIVNFGAKLKEYLIDRFINQLNISERIRELFNNLKQSISYDEITKFFSNLVDELSVSLSNFLTQFQELFDRLSIDQAILNFKKQTFDNILNIFKEFIDNLYLKGQSIEQAFLDLKINIVKSLLKLITDIITTSKLLTPEFMRNLSEAIDQALQGNYVLLRRLVTNFADKVLSLQPRIQRIYKEVVSAFGLTIEDISDSISEPTKRLNNSIQESVSSLEESITEAGNEISEFTDSFAGLIESSRSRLESSILSRVLQLRLKAAERSYLLRTGEAKILGRIPGFGQVPTLLSESPVINKTINISFKGLSFSEQKKVFDLWQEKEEFSNLTKWD